MKEQKAVGGRQKAVKPRDAFAAFCFAAFCLLSFFIPASFIPAFKSDTICALIGSRDAQAQCSLHVTIFESFRANTIRNRRARKEAAFI
jgi:hypothetical protein